jgi:hypothetical protein
LACQAKNKKTLDILKITDEKLGMFFMWPISACIHHIHSRQPSWFLWRRTCIAMAMVTKMVAG